MFRNAAMGLPDYSNGEPFWPKYALLTHAIELSAKAFAKHSVESGKLPGKESQDESTAIRDASAITDSTVERLIFIFAQSINPR
jgi:hypothetical protein